MRRLTTALTFILLIATACTAVVTPAPPSSDQAAAIATTEGQPQTLPPPSGQVVDPENLEYLGAFRLPGGEDRPETFAYGGNAMTFNPDGDPAGADDGFRGSLFVMGHDRIPYAEPPNGNQVAEVSIPAPVMAENVEELNTAEFLQDFHEVAPPQFASLEEIPRVGMQYTSRKHRTPHTLGSARRWTSPTRRAPGTSATRTCTA
jgi:hypothetical protein